MLSRRRFLAGASGGMVAVALGRAALPPLLGKPEPNSAVAASVTPTPAPTVIVQALDGPPYRLITPNLGNDGFFPTLQLSQSTPFQGGAIYLRATQAQSGSASIFGRTYQLVPSPDGLEGIVPFGVLDPPGDATLQVQLIDMQGQALNYSNAITVRATQWTVDDIILPPPPTPDPNATPPPGPTAPPLENEGPRLAETYLGISPRAWELPWVIPIPLGGANIRISGYFGEQRSFNGGPRSGHHGGTDIGAPFGTPIQSTNHGRVVMSELTLIRGHLVAIDHGGGIFSSYGHMQKRLVDVGDFVNRGDVIGEVGSTGLSTGAHLHWELAVGGILVDGLRWLDGTQGF
ncbi:MAG TPA: M23 family metallopeptidase [Tepidiformaceae bacterium]|mgnify:FL=1|nr:M23 family metallopeptidase [Tepidiformaceae bacterium]